MLLLLKHFITDDDSSATVTIAGSLCLSRCLIWSSPDDFLKWFNCYIAFAFPQDVFFNTGWLSGLMFYFQYIFWVIFIFFYQQMRGTEQ